MDAWVEAKDPKSGRSYFYNKTTKKTTWVKPVELGGENPAETPAPTSAESPAQTPATAAAASVTADGGEDEAAFWKESADPKSGRKYYYNKKTKETTWKRPPILGEDPAAPAAAAPPAATTSAASTAATSPAASTAATPSSSAAASATSGESDMGDWREAKDPRTSKPYWYNKVTKKTTWKNPFEAESETPSSPAAAAASPAPASQAKKLARDDSDDDGDDRKSAGAKDESDDDDEAKGELQQMKKMQGMSEAQLEDEKANINDEEEEGYEFRFAKHRHGWFNRTFRVGDVHDETALLTFKKSLIKKALLKQNRELDEEAVQCFKNVMSYMGDRKSSKPPLDHAKKLLRSLMSLAGSVRDEVYMQLVKQTTQNPRVASSIKGWELMVFCIATFPPSKHLKSFLMDYIKKTLTSSTHEKITALADVCQKQLPKIVLMGQRKQVPSKLEMECLIDMKPIPIRVLCCNGSFKTFMVDSYTLVKEVEEMLVQKYSLTCSQPFALFEQAEVNQERILDPKDRVLDIMASWENRPSQAELNKQLEGGKQPKSNRNTKFDKHKDADKKVVHQVIEYKDYLYKAKLVLKTSNKEVMADPEAIKLIYLQAVSDVVTDRYPSNEKDITVLAALQLQATHGDYKKDIHVSGWLAPKILEYIPRHLVCKKGALDKIQENLVKEWEAKILAKYQKVAEFTSLDAKLNYLDYVQEWTFYGASFFVVEQRQFKDYPSPLTLGINSEGVLLMHPEKKTVLENYQFTDIVTWGHSDEKFIVVVGNIVQQRKLIFKTSEGKIMNHLIHDYVKFKVKAKGG